MATVYETIQNAADHHGLTELKVNFVEVSPTEMWTATAKFGMGKQVAQSGADVQTTLTALFTDVQAAVTRWNSQCTCPEHCPKKLDPTIG